MKNDKKAVIRIYENNLDELRRLMPNMKSDAYRIEALLWAIQTKNYEFSEQLVTLRTYQLKDELI